jgi:hypothetical protein
VEERSLPVSCCYIASLSSLPLKKTKRFNHGAGSRSNYTPNVDFAFNSIEHGSLNIKLFSVAQLNSNIIVSVIWAKSTTKRSLSDSDFFEWLRGFTDGEGSFQITLIEKWKTPNFRYMIYLHKDDAPLLNYIKNRLNLGNVYVYDHFGSFIISKTNELLQLIKIF